MEGFVYSATFTSDLKKGGFVVTFTDLPEAITQGENVKDALFHAADCLEEAIANRIVMGLAIPEPSPLKKEQYAITLHAQMAAKAALYMAIKEIGITKVELASQLNCDEKEVRRLLDPHHSSNLSRIEAALHVIGKQLIVGLQEAV